MFGFILKKHAFYLLCLSYYHITSAFLSESVLCNCLNVSEPLVLIRPVIRTHNHLVSKRTLNHSAKLARVVEWLSVRLRTKCFLVRVPLLSLIVLEIFEYQHVHLIFSRQNLIFRKL